MVDHKDAGRHAKKLISCFPGFLILVLLLSSGARADDLPERAYLSGVTGHPQSANLSCESRSAADWAAYWGVTISEWEFQLALPSSDNPDEGFVGSPNDPVGGIPPSSYGVHAGPVADSLQDYGFEANAEHDITWDDLRYEIAAGRPVIVWVIGLVWPGTPIAYTDSDGDETIVAHFEHTMILIGYDEDSAHLVDAYTGWTETYPLESFLASWDVLGNMAVTGYWASSGEADSDTEPVSAAANPGFYTVQRGDYLIALAEQFGVSWQDLASLNQIVYPYVIYAGQVLELPGGAAAAPVVDAPIAETPAPVVINLNRLYFPVIVIPASPISPEPTPVPAPETDAPESYIVQRGDFLKAIAEQFDLDWEALAALNDIPYPYTIYPGQVLRLR